MKKLIDFNPNGWHMNCGRRVKCHECHNFSDMILQNGEKLFKFAIYKLIDQKIYPSSFNVFKFLDFKRKKFNISEKIWRDEVLIHCGWIRVFDKNGNVYKWRIKIT